MTQQELKLRRLKAAIYRIGLHVNSNAALKELQKEDKTMEKQLIRLGQVEETETLKRKKQVRSVRALVRWLTHQFKNKMSQAQAHFEQRVKQQDSKLKSLKAAI